MIRKLAKKHDVTISEPRIKIDVADPKGLLKDFQETPRDADVACFTATLERLETDLEPMKQRAAAWAVGDVETLQRLQSRTQEATCLDAVTSVPSLQEEYTRIRARAYSEWMTLVENALAHNAVTLAILPMPDLLSPTGRLSQLGRRATRSRSRDYGAAARHSALGADQSRVARVSSECEHGRCHGCAGLYPPTGNGDSQRLSLCPVRCRIP